MIHYGWTLFRWTETQVRNQPDRVKEELLLFLSRIPGLFRDNEYLPKQQGFALDLHDHQQDALDRLAEARERGETIALLTHATGSGKTVIAVADAQRIGGAILYVAHTRNLVNQTLEVMQELWPEASAARFSRGHDLPNTLIMVSTVQLLVRHLEKFSPDRFDYIIIDEAHHAASDSYKRVLEHFTAQFTLGLTATPERMDGRSILNLFVNNAHRLSLQQAVERGILVPIRCVRVQTNVDLTKVRFNQVHYNRRDLEEKVLVPARDGIILDTYMGYVKGRRTVIFAVNVRHAEALAERFSQQGIPAAAVSGGDTNEVRSARLKDFEEGRLWVLCACDILNEGWDCPAVEVLFMARPTLSRTIYLQQLGRGTRRSPGKESLWVFDFIDNSSRYNQSENLHRVTGQKSYRKGGIVVGPEEQKMVEERAFARQEKPAALLELALEIERMEEIDLFDWRSAVEGMLTAAEMEFQLAATEGTLSRAIMQGKISADHSVEVGSRTWHYFHKESQESLRQQLGLEKTGSHTLRDRFETFVEQMDMSASYKPVFMIAFIDTMDQRGRAKISSIVTRFRAFYQQRSNAGKIIDRATLRIAKLEELSDDELTQIIISMPFRKFAQKHFLQHDKDLARLRVHPDLWRQTGKSDWQRIGERCHQALENYYQRFDEKAEK